MSESRGLGIWPAAFGMFLMLGGWGCSGLTAPRSDPSPRPQGTPVEFFALACCQNECRVGAPLKDVHRQPLPAPPPSASGGDLPTPVYKPGLMESEEAFRGVFGCPSGLDFSKNRVFTTVVGGQNAHGHIWGVTEHEGEILVHVQTTVACMGTVTDMSETLVVVLPVGKAPVKIVPMYTKEEEPCPPVP